MLTVMVFALGSVSGAHFNPAVSLAITLRGKMPVDLMFMYMGAQITGGVLAAGCYTAITGGAFIFAPLWHYTAGARAAAGGAAADRAAHAAHRRDLRDP